MDQYTLTNLDEKILENFLSKKPSTMPYIHQSPTAIVMATSSDEFSLWLGKEWGSSQVARKRRNRDVVFVKKNTPIAHIIFEALASHNYYETGNYSELEENWAMYCPIPCEDCHMCYQCSVMDENVRALKANPKSIQQDEPLFF